MHRKYVLKGKSDAFTFDELFKGVKFTQVPLNIAYLYASNDPVITTELCDFQRPYLTYDPTCDMFDRNGMNGVAWVFHNIEMPCVEVICDMEDAGVCFDTEYNGNLSVKYNRLLQEKLDEFYDVLSEYQDKIDKYKATHLDSKLDDPINVSSPAQLAILFYDILGYKSVNEKHKRGTGADILATWNTPLSKVLLEFRNLEKLISTYIDKLPDCINPNDKRIHCKFNQYGADTGRMSSNDPNLQNIPSKNHDIRQAFIASANITEVDEIDNCFIVDRWCEVQTQNGWVYADKVKVGDLLSVIDTADNNSDIVTKIEILDTEIKIYL